MAPKSRTPIRRSSRSKENTMPRLIASGLAVAAGVMITLPFLAPVSHAGTTGSGPLVLPDSAITPTSMTIGGAESLSTTRTVAHWAGSALNPVDGVTYGFNMVGANPALGTSTTVTVDVVPVNVVVAGVTFN